LDFSVREYRQNLEMTQSKKILTRGPCDSINIRPDVGEFRHELLHLVEELSNLTLEIETADNSGFSKVIRGNREWPSFIARFARGPDGPVRIQQK
jgi:hypothetical protein